MTVDQFKGKMSEILHTDYNLVTNRAATAIYLALNCYAPRGRVLIPSNICLSPIMAAKIANYDVVFIGTSSFQMDLKEVIKHIESDKNVNAVLLPELYGYPIRNLASFWDCIKERDILIIEDLAQSLGKSRISHFSGKPTVVTIYSFGPTKVIETFRCGVLSTNNDSFYKDLEAKFQELGTNSSSLFRKTSQEYDRMYINLRQKAENERNWSQFYTAASLLNPVLFVPRFELEDISDEFEFNWTELIRARNCRHSRLLELFKDYDQVLLPPEVDPIHPVWRTTVRVESPYRDLIVQDLRDKGMPVSTWYKAMHQMLRGNYVEHNDSLNEAVRFEQEVVNLFLDLANFEEYYESIRIGLRERLG